MMIDDLYYHHQQHHQYQQHRIIHRLPCHFDPPSIPTMLLHYHSLTMMIPSEQLIYPFPSEPETLTHSARLHYYFHHHHSSNYPAVAQDAWIIPPLPSVQHHHYPPCHSPYRHRHHPLRHVVVVPTSWNSPIPFPLILVQSVPIASLYSPQSSSSSSSHSSYQYRLTHVEQRYVPEIFQMLALDRTSPSPRYHLLVLCHRHPPPCCCCFVVWNRRRLVEVVWEEELDHRKRRLIHLLLCRLCVVDRW
mmetsp:Transcript_15952/g.18883  ORF Transcript_15952/g.18883 Transcript_15952/m.18883 type:complete len:247 (-) Transcript_15952:77-817(-)